MHFKFCCWHLQKETKLLLQGISLTVARAVLCNKLLPEWPFCWQQILNQEITVPIHVAGEEGRNALAGWHCFWAARASPSTCTCHPARLCGTGSSHTAPGFQLHSLVPLLVVGTVSVYSWTFPILIRHYCSLLALQQSRGHRTSQLDLVIWKS